MGKQQGGYCTPWKCQYILHTQADFLRVAGRVEFKDAKFLGFLVLATKVALLCKVVVSVLDNLEAADFK